MYSQQIRDGSSTETIQFEGCSSTNATIVTSRNRWMWVQFKSNYRNTDTGFTAQFTAVSSSNADEKSPWPDCQRVSYSCPNKECIETGYRCDGQNDCGCTGDGCDEDGCGGLNWSEYELEFQ